MIPASTDGVNYYRLATWAFEMRKYRNVVVDLAWDYVIIFNRLPEKFRQSMRILYYNLPPKADKRL